jgi:hypothetical protein
LRWGGNEGRFAVISFRQPPSDDVTSHFIIEYDRSLVFLGGRGGGAIRREEGQGNAAEAEVDSTEE